MTKTILVLGYFGLVSNQIDGQTIKTRNIYQLLHDNNKHKFQLESFDTETFKINKWNIIGMFKLLYKADKLIYIAAHNNLKYLFPLIYLFSKLFKIDIHFIVVGGWLSDFLKRKYLHVRLLKNIKGIYPQTLFLCKLLKEKYKFSNVYHLNNFRIVTKIQPEIKKTESSTLKFVFMARVHPLKGVGTLFKIIDTLPEEYIHSIIIDIYGPIHNEYEMEFNKKISNFKHINYQGIVQPYEVYSVLSKYDLMLFPTQYYTEGFPGSILDAFIANIPVIATKWKYAEEFIEHNTNGIITSFENEVDFIEQVHYLIENPNVLIRLKEGVRSQSLKYSPEAAWNILYKNIF